jgi:hypothetical protein
MKRKKEKRKKRVSKWYDVAKKQIDSEKWNERWRSRLIQV